MVFIMQEVTRGKRKQRAAVKIIANENTVNALLPVKVFHILDTVECAIVKLQQHIQV